MIHTTTHSAKFHLLARRLRAAIGTSPVSVETITVGLLERMWHLAATSAPRGDIGRHDDELIAEMVGWDGSAEILIAALVDSRWLDRHPEHRLVVHDWHDHAPNFIKGNVLKMGGFVSQQATPQKGAPKTPPQGPPPGDGPQRGGPSNLTKSNPTKQNQENPLPPAAAGGEKPSRKPRERDPLFDAIAEITGSDPVVSGSHIGRVKSLAMKAEPPYTPEEIRRMADPAWQAREMPWLEGRKLTLGEVEKNIGRLRNPSGPASPKPGRGYRSHDQQLLDELNSLGAPS